jgi:hypothetical protein
MFWVSIKSMPVITLACARNERKFGILFFVGSFVSSHYLIHPSFSDVPSTNPAYRIFSISGSVGSVDGHAEDPFSPILCAVLFKYTIA